VYWELPSQCSIATICVLKDSKPVDAIFVEVRETADLGQGPGAMLPSPASQYRAVQVDSRFQPSVLDSPHDGFGIVDGAGLLSKSRSGVNVASSVEKRLLTTSASSTGEL
jgi:hypothetical protein